MSVYPAAGLTEGITIEGGGGSINRMIFEGAGTLLTLLRILFLGQIGSISYVLPIRQKFDILNRDIRVLLL